MSLGIFYNEVDQYIINDIQTHIGHIPNVLYLYTSEKKKISVGAYFIKLGIGNDIHHFLKHITEYESSLFNKRFDIINIRFSIRHFFNNPDNVNQFIGFITRHLKGGGFMIGYALSNDKLNVLFMENDEVFGGPYYLKLLPSLMSESPRPYGNAIQLSRYNPNDVSYMVNLEELVKICFQNGLFYIGTIDFEKIYTNYTPNIKLQHFERTFGFLNYIFIFQYSMLRTDENVMD